MCEKHEKHVRAHMCENDSYYFCVPGRRPGSPLRGAGRPPCDRGWLRNPAPPAPRCPSGPAPPVSNVPSTPPFLTSA
eukprot:427610-Prorocentrum_minimum.AAC.3